MNGREAFFKGVYEGLHKEADVDPATQKRLGRAISDVDTYNKVNPESTWEGLVGSDAPNVDTSGRGLAAKAMMTAGDPNNILGQGINYARRNIGSIAPVVGMAAGSIGGPWGAALGGMAGNYLAQRVGSSPYAKEKPTDIGSILGEGATSLAGYGALKGVGGLASKYLPSVASAAEPAALWNYAKSRGLPLPSTPSWLSRGANKAMELAEWKGEIPSSLARIPQEAKDLFGKAYAAGKSALPYVSRAYEAGKSMLPSLPSFPSMAPGGVLANITAPFTGTAAKILIPTALAMRYGPGLAAQSSEKMKEVAPRMAKSFVGGALEGAGGALEEGWKRLGTPLVNAAQNLFNRTPDITKEQTPGDRLRAQEIARNPSQP